MNQQQQVPTCEICKEKPATLMVDGRLICLDCFSKRDGK